MTVLKYDKNCIPYPRKTLYWLVTLPYIFLLIATAVYLWQFSILISSVYISFYIVSVILHGYICAFSGCPYKGTMCPGAFAYFPVGKVASLFDKLNVKKSTALIGLFFLIVILCILGIITLPLYWIAKMGLEYSIGYAAIIMGYFAVFVMTICPKCAMRFNCPMARLSNFMHTHTTGKDILGTH